MAYGRVRGFSAFRIRNFKSIQDLTLKLGRVTVMIGENGSGKSNILEALGFASCAAAGKLDNAVLASRGIRVCEPGWMTAAFGKAESPNNENPPIRFTVGKAGDGPDVELMVTLKTEAPWGGNTGWKVSPSWNGSSLQLASDTEQARWEAQALRREFLDGIINEMLANRHLLAPEYRSIEREVLEKRYESIIEKPIFDRLASKRLSESASDLGLSNFMIYAPENTLLRTPSPESAVLPLGSKGEGLFRHLESFAAPENEAELKDMKERLKIFGWFEDFLAPDAAAVAQARLQIRDRWLDPGRAVIDQRSANEGFLYLLFYLALMMSSRTPKFFAIDNLDNALNPKLCAALMRQIVELATRYDKQVLCTTHNPAILDGLDLRDDAQRLYSVQRNEDGQTTVNRVRAPKPMPGQAPMKLSAAFLAGHIGGLPEHF